MKFKRGEEWLRSPQKRAMDVALASLAVVPAAAAGSVAALALATEMRRKPWFVQPRMGRSENDPLEVPKLVTLKGPITHTASPEGYYHDRASKIGKIVRMLHVDEAPQLLLILRGDMTVVGPRPIVFSEHETMMDTLSPKEQSEYLAARAVCAPGVVSPDSHLQHDEDGVLTLYDKAMNVVEYANKASFKGDMQLLSAVALHMTVDVFNGDNPDIKYTV